MKFKKFRFTGFLVVLLLISLAAGCGLSGTPEKKNNPPVNPQPTKEQVELTLYFADDQAMYLVPEKRSVAKEGKAVAELLIEGLIQGPSKKGLGVTIPEGTKLLSLEIVEGVAFVNFSKEAKTNHWGGTTGENMTIQSVALTLAELPEVEKIQFLIEGKKEEAIWGHNYTGEPIAPDPGLVARK